MTWGTLRTSRWGIALLYLAISTLALPADAGSRLVLGGNSTDLTAPTLELADDEGYAYETTGSGMNTKFPVTSDLAVVVRGADKKPLSFVPAGINIRDANGTVLRSQQPSTGLAFGAGTHSVTYVGTYVGVNDVFTTRAKGLKHDVVLLAPPALSREAAWLGASYDLTLPDGYRFHGATAADTTCTGTSLPCADRLANDVLMVVDAGGSIHYLLGAIVVIDANGSRTNGRYRLAAGPNRTQRISLEAPADWLRSAAYPVTIDPTIDFVAGSSNNIFPFDENGNDPQGAMQTFYTPAQVGSTGLITHIGVHATFIDVDPQSFSRIEILVGETTSDQTAFSNTYANNYDAAASVVVFDSSFDIPTTVAVGDWVEFPLTTPFNYSGVNNLVVEYRVHAPPTPASARFIVELSNAGTTNARVYTVNATIGAIAGSKSNNGYSARFVFEAARTINELRIDQSGADDDEYIEITGFPGDTVDDLTLVVIGDGAAGSGVIEEVTPLSGVFDVNGFFVLAKASLSLGTPDQTTGLNFENSDNLTFLLVKGFSGSNGDDLDTNDDGVLDTTPWTDIVDSVSLVETVGSGDQIYSTTTVGPDGTFVPAHVKRCEDATGPFLAGMFDDLSRDTPGAANDCPACGNGWVDGTEECDGDGAGTGGETAACDTDCTFQSCGDGNINTTALETCDGDGAGTGGETATCDTDCTVASCGDGVVNTTASETCDGDGAGTGGETATCDTDCTAASCGDGNVNATASETCDGDGAGTGGETATCDADCTVASCGDGVVNTTASEACDGDGAGTGGETATCDTDCTTATCGDGNVNTTASETCDGDGAGTGGETATCDTDCTAASCGDGNVNITATEACDGDGAGTGGETAMCDTDCTAASCGDGNVNATASEDCDGDGAGTGGETATCDTDCTTATCGDGTINNTAGETCEGGKTVDCDSDCTAVTCGDGHTNTVAGEECDGDGAGTPGETATCDTDCTTAVCGDTVVNSLAGEDCDDGSETPACNADCTTSSCGDGVTNTTAGEACDDGAESATCNADCTANTCGDGIVNATAGETCDDSNDVDGDGCSAACIIEEPTASGGGCCDSGGGSGNNIPSMLLLLAVVALTMRRRQRRTTA